MIWDLRDGETTGGRVCARGSRISGRTQMRGPRTNPAAGPAEEGPMQIDIRYQPSYSLAIVGLGAEESVQAESGAMVSMSSNIQIETGMKGGVLGAITRSVLGGETLFA